MMIQWSGKVETLLILQSLRNKVYKSFLLNWHQCKGLCALRVGGVIYPNWWHTHNHLTYWWSRDRDYLWFKCIAVFSKCLCFL